MASQVQTYSLGERSASQTFQPQALLWRNTGLLPRRVDISLFLNKNCCWKSFPYPKLNRMILKVGGSKAWSVFLKNAQRRRLRRKNKLKNGKFSTWAPLPTLIFSLSCYPLRENPCKEGLLVQLAKKFLTRFYVFFKSVDFVLLQEIEPFIHLLHQSSNSIFDFNLRASFARFVISS